MRGRRDKSREGRSGNMAPRPSCPQRSRASNRGEKSVLITWMPSGLRARRGAHFYYGEMHDYRVSHRTNPRRYPNICVHACRSTPSTASIPASFSGQQLRSPQGPLCLAEAQDWTVRLWIFAGSQQKPYCGHALHTVHAWILSGRRHNPRSRTGRMTCWRAPDNERSVHTNNSLQYF